MGQNQEMPQNHEDTKLHKVLIISRIILVNLSAFESWWQNKNRVNSNIKYQIIGNKHVNKSNFKIYKNEKVNCHLNFSFVV